MKEHKNLIIKVFFSRNGHINQHRIKKVNNYPNIHNYLKLYYSDSTSINETLMRIKLNIDVHPLCPLCSCPTIFLGRYKKPFSKYCSHKCSEVSNERKEKFRETCLRKYGCTTPLSSKELREIGKKTCKRKYGVEHPFQSKEIQVKYRDTCKKKYGVDWNSKTLEWKTEMKEIISSSSIQLKRYNTMKEHNSFNSSKPEEELYLYIKEKFPEVKRQYKDKDRYPFYCDFYIPSKDLYIEYNGHQSHGSHPFDPTNDNDKIKLDEWIYKYDDGKHPMYKAMISTWTKRDVEKRKIALKNKLNFKELWNLDEAKKFIDTINF